MKSALVLAVLFSLSLYGASLATSGCSSSICTATSAPIASGTYVIGPEALYHPQNGKAWSADNYQLTVSEDRRTFEEMFDLDGKRYHLIYSGSVTPQTSH